MKKDYKIIVVIVIVAIALAAYLSTQKKTPEDTAPLKVGIATLLHGDFAIVGENIVKSATLAVEEINKNGGIKGRKIELVTEDAGYASKEGLSAAEKLVKVDGVRYLIAGMSSNGTLAAASFLNANKIVSLSPVTGGSNIDNAGNYIFRIANSDVLAGRDLADAMIKQGITTAAVVYEKTEYTSDIATSFTQHYEEQGGKILTTETFQPNIKDYRTTITKLKGLNPGGLLLLSQLGTNAAEFIKQSRQLKYHPATFTDFTLISNPDVVKIVGSLKGVYYADPAYASTRETDAFVKRYEEVNKMKPPIPFHSFATYDSFAILKEAVERVGDNPGKVADYIAHLKNHTGLMGTYSFDAKGNSELGFVVKQVAE